jgi:hypothetical protein
LLVQKNNYFFNITIYNSQNIIFNVTVVFQEFAVIATGKSGKTVGIKGKIIRSQAREIIASVLELLKKKQHMAVSQFRKKRLLAATKISDKTYRQVTKEIAEIEYGEKFAFSSPPKKRTCFKPKSGLVQGEIETIRSIIHDFFLQSLSK